MSGSPRQFCNSTCSWCARQFFAWWRKRAASAERDGGRSGGGSFAAAAATSVRAEKPNAPDCSEVSDRQPLAGNPPPSRRTD